MVGVKKKNRVSKDCAKQCSNGKKPSCCPSSHRCRPCPAQPSFFKIMLGDFREVLFIPPRFADKLVGLLNQYVDLEDFHGNSSRVKVSMVDGSLAFQVGWPNFVLDHSIGIGEILVFRYVSKSLFSVQIFGINACERVHFVDRNTNNLCTKNRNETDLSLERSQLPKRRKILEASKDECFPAKKDLEKKDDPSDSDIEVMEGKSVAKGSVEYGNGLENFPQDYHDSGSPQIVDVLNVTGSPVNMISGQATEEPEEKSSPVEQPKPCVHEISLHNQETVETGLLSDHVARFPLIEESLSGHEHGHGKSQTAPIVACTISETKHQIACCREIVPYNPQSDSSLPLNTTEKGLAGDQEKHRIRKIGMRGHQTLEVMGTNMNASEEVACKFLVTEEGMCHIVNDDLYNGLDAIRIAPVNLSFSNIGTSISCNDSVRMSRDASCHQDSVPQVNCLGPTADCIEDETSNGMHASEENGNTSGSLSRKDFSPLIGSIGSTLQDMPAIDTGAGHTCQSGIVPDTLQGEDEKEDAFCLRSQNLKAVKSEAIDSNDLFLPNSFCFGLTLASNTQCWLELPQRLPFHKGKKKHERKVVILRDPSHRLWPVLYHESAKFTGFICGWKDFAIANNLQQGNLCEFFEAADEFEPTFQVQISQP